MSERIHGPASTKITAAHRAGVSGPPRGGRIGWPRAVVLILSVLLLVVVTFCYARRPDSCAALTFWPAWAWPLLGLLLAGLCACRAGRRAVAVVVALWLVFVVVYVEEAGALLRFRRLPAAGWQAEENGGLRVISLNCLGQRAAAREVLPYRPDIVLLQESPGLKAAEALAEQLFGGEGAAVSGMDGAIVVRGEASPVEPRSPVFVTQTHVRLQSGLEMEIVNVHLEAPVARFDLSSGDVWRDHTVKRQVHRRQMEEIAARMASVPREMPLIVGGDFNEPAGDAVLAPLNTRLCDTFREAGLGWGNTVVNEFPVLRIDQVWVSDHFRVAAVAARRTQHSDHRMVICDLVAREPARPQSPAPG